MAKLVWNVADNRIYQLDEYECRIYGREYPTYVYWRHECDIGNMGMTENEAGSLSEMIEYLRATE